MSATGDSAARRPPFGDTGDDFPASETDQSSDDSTLPPAKTPEDSYSSSGLNFESVCWGCGLRLVLPSSAPVFKCGWCGAITKQNATKREPKNLLWRTIRDRCFLALVLTFMTVLICGGAWAVFPTLFMISDLRGIIHSIVTFILAVATITLFSLSAFTDAGTPPPKVWGSYPAVQKDDLQDNTFCLYCSKPKCPRTHHCSSCRTCVLDMDHHCPFIGNCVGASNHRYFVGFLILAVISVAYSVVLSGYALLEILPSLENAALEQLSRVNNNMGLLGIVKEILAGFLQSPMFMNPRGLVLVYVFVSCICIEIGLSVLLWQQLYFIYEGRTYLNSLTSQAEVERDCRNLCRFFGLACPNSGFLWSYNFSKIHKMV